MPLKALLGVLALLLSLDILIFEVFVNEALFDLRRLEAWIEGLAEAEGPVVEGEAADRAVVAVEVPLAVAYPNPVGDQPCQAPPEKPG